MCELGKMDFWMLRSTEISLSVGSFLESHTAVSKFHSELWFDMLLAFSHEKESESRR